MNAPKFETIEDLILELRKDREFRASFIENPIQSLEKVGMNLNPQARKEFIRLLIENREYIEKYLDNSHGFNIL